MYNIFMITDDRSVRDSERKAAIRHFDTDQVIYVHVLIKVGGGGGERNSSMQWYSQTRGLEVPGLRTLLVCTC
jgi:hypothetical protein